MKTIIQVYEHKTGAVETLPEHPVIKEIQEVKRMIVSSLSLKEELDLMQLSPSDREIELRRKGMLLFDKKEGGNIQRNS